jgi:hypothetical protein
LLGRHKAALDEAWERSQAGTGAVHEEGGLLGWDVIDDGETDQKERSVNRRYSGSGIGLRGKLDGFNYWAYRQTLQDKQSVRFDYTYHTHPLDEGEIDPVKGVPYGDPEKVTLNDYGTSETTRLTGVIVTKNSIIVHDNTRKLCTFAR